MDLYNKAWQGEIAVGAPLIHLRIRAPKKKEMGKLRIIADDCLLVEATPKKKFKPAFVATIIDGAQEIRIMNQYEKTIERRLKHGLDRKAKKIGVKDKVEEQKRNYLVRLRTACLLIWILYTLKSQDTWMQSLEESDYQTQKMERIGLKVKYIGRGMYRYSLLPNEMHESEKAKMETQKLLSSRREKIEPNIRKELAAIGWTSMRLDK